MKRTLSVAAMLLMGLAAGSRAQPAAVTLKVGDAAPALPAGEWVKGDKVAGFEKGKVYVLECWATWCGPCIAAIPHVTELQKKYADKGLTVIGMNVWEQDASKVKPFVEKMGDKMGYAVLMDTPAGPEGAAAKTWLEAAGQDGIPCSFVIDKDSKIAWIGHPMEMEPVLEKVIAGTYDAKGAAGKAEKMKEANAKFVAAMRANKIDDALAILDAAAKDDPEFAKQINGMKFRVLLRANRPDDAMKLAKTMVDETDQPQVLNEIAWTIVDPESELKDKDLDLAMKAAVKADELSEHKDPMIIDTLARVHFLKGDKAKALELQTKAVGLATDESLKAELEKTLAEYK